MKLKTSLAVAALMCLPGIASAVPLSWNYSGTCLFGCSGTLTGTLTGWNAPAGGIRAAGPGGYNDPTSVPEPATLALLGLGLAGLGFARRRGAG